MPVALRFALYLDLMLLFGTAAFGLPGTRTTRRAGPIVTGLLALLGIVISAGLFASMAGTMIGGSVLDIDSETLKFLIFGSALGQALIAREVALGLLLVLIQLRVRWGPVAVLLSAIALGSLAWLGHAGATEGLEGYLHLASDVVHLWAAGAWVGALIMLLMIVAEARGNAASVGRAHAALEKFGPTGTIIVATLVVTGTYNLLMIIGLAGLLHLPGTLYGQLLLLKLALFAVMLGLAASNRWRLTPRLAVTETSESGTLAVRRSITVEACAAIVILMLVAWLGTLDPHAPSPI